MIRPGWSPQIISDQMVEDGCDKNSWKSVGHVPANQVYAAVVASFHGGLPDESMQNRRRPNQQGFSGDSSHPWSDTFGQSPHSLQTVE